MNTQGKSLRKRERLELALPTRVHCRESLDHEWVELTRLIDVTPFGARFSLSRPTETGRLLHMTMPMPRQLRCFDHVEQQYKVWALVRNARTLVAKEGELPRYEVGVAFIGRRPPASFELNPSQRYEVAKTLEETGLWSLREVEEKRHVPSTEPRPETRHNIPVEVRVDVFDEKGRISNGETTVTENISRRGAAVFTSLNVANGRFVRLTSSQYNLSVTAAVRARRIGPDGIPRLHLEFVGQEWPLG
jgi:hypothetical protein